MTKSNGKGRGGVRSGAGRKKKSTSVDWNAVGKAYFSDRKPVHEICKEFGLSYGDLLAYAAARGWVWPSPPEHPHDMGELGSALAGAMFSVPGGVQRRARCFVRAMAILGANVVDIAAALSVTPEDLRKEFAKELTT